MGERRGGEPRKREAKANNKGSKGREEVKQGTRGNEAGAKKKGSRGQEERKVRFDYVELNPTYHNLERRLLFFIPSRLCYNTL